MAVELLKMFLEVRQTWHFGQRRTCHARMWDLGVSDLFIFIMATAIIFTVIAWYWYDRLRDKH